MRRYLVIAVLFLSYSRVSHGEMITVLNPGFDQLVLPGPGGRFNDVFDIPNWSRIGESSTFKPGPSQFPVGVPEGGNVAALANQTVSKTIT